MKRGEALNKMLVLTTTKFDGIFDKGGTPYILRCLKVMYYLKTDDEELQCIGLGHDLVEDTDVTYQLLREMGFSERVITGIRAMTKVPVKLTTNTWSVSRRTLTQFVVSWPTCVTTVIFVD
jgi:(p)ppGpp synthase/HD superfamily hydrolase